jgi:hypothetical protein
MCDFLLARFKKEEGVSEIINVSEEHYKVWNTRQVSSIALYDEFARLHIIWP